MSKESGLPGASNFASGHKQQRRCTSQGHLPVHRILSESLIDSLAKPCPLSMEAPCVHLPLQQVLKKKLLSQSTAVALARTPLRLQVEELAGGSSPDTHKLSWVLWVNVLLRRAFPATVSLP